jgi:hypothetical protein
VGVKNRPCTPCEDLLSNDNLHGILERIAGEIHESTPLIFMPVSGLIATARRKIENLRTVKLLTLNDTRKLLAVLAELEEHKQFVMAVASGQVTRVAQLVKACLNNHAGIRGVLERYWRACNEVYNPKGFVEDEKMLMLLILRLGGARLAGIVHRALGLPGLTTIRANTVIRPLRASPGMPTIEEIQANIYACAEGEPTSYGPPTIVHRVLMLDEIHVEERPRWDDRTNKILGVCRECCHKVSLELNTQADLEVFFRALDDGDIHLACEVCNDQSRDKFVLMLAPNRQLLLPSANSLRSPAGIALDLCASLGRINTKQALSTRNLLRKSWPPLKGCALAITSPTAQLISPPMAKRSAVLLWYSNA